jgi:hypothetical protein
MIVKCARGVQRVVDSRTSTQDALHPDGACALESQPCQKLSLWGVCISES